MNFNGGMFNADAIESTGSAVPDEQNGELGEIADARTNPEEGSGSEEEKPADVELTEEQKEEARLALEKANEEKTPEEIEAARIAAEANKAKTPEAIAAEKLEAEKLATEQKEQETAKVRAEIRKEFLKEMGVNTEEELKAKLAGPAKELTPEEKAENDEKYNANLLSFATKNKLLNTDEFVALSNLKKASDTDIAFGNFAAEYKELNKDRKDSDNNPNPVSDEEVKEAFNQLYHIDSQDDTLKKIGEKQLKLVADQSRLALESKFKDAKETFDDYNFRASNDKPYRNFVSESVKSAYPEKLEFDGVEGSKINIPLDKADIKEIEKLFINDGAFEDYLANGATQSAKEQIAKTVQAFLFHKNKDAIIKTVRDTSYEAGVKKGSVGAVAPFTKDAKQSAEVTGGKELSTAEKEKLKNSFSSPYGRI